MPLVDLARLAAGGGHPGARWRLDGEDLQANLVRLDQGDRIQPHRNDEVEVLVVVVAGRGELTLDGQVHQLAPMVVAHLPKGRSGRSRPWTGRSRTCRSTAAGRRDCRWVGTPSDPEVPSGKPPGRSAGSPIRPLYRWARRQVVMTLHRKTARPMTQAQSSRDLENTQVQNLAAAGTKLLERAAAAPAGRAALTLVAGASAPLNRRCWRCGEACSWPSTTRLGSDAPGHLGPGAAGGERAKLRAGVRATTCDPVDSASVGELGGRWRPIDRARNTIQLRETPGNLSGSGSETHQHFSPADATCCHSLLLDPDATIALTCTNGCFCWSPDEENRLRVFPYH